MEKTFILWDSDNKSKVNVSAKKVGQEWKAFCPFHDDRKTPNLYINEEKGVYYCFVCHTKGHLFESGFTNPERTIIDLYDYDDENRNLIYQVLKYDKAKEGSKFLQRRPDGNGGWIWNLQGIEPILYNLPELAIKSDKPIYIVEGEKDCKSLKKLGLLATTNSGGAGKWRDSYKKWFIDRVVIVIPDNDKPGFNHINDVVRSIKPVAKSIKRLILPGLEKGEDVSDWINNGGTLEKLHKIMLETPEIDLTKEEKPEEKHKIISAYDLLKSNIPPEPMLIGRGLLPERGYILIGAYAKEGKTLLCLQMALNLVSGTHFLDEFKVTRKFKVLYLHGEDNNKRINEILKQQIEGLKQQGITIQEEDLKNLHYDDPSIFCLDDEQDMREFKEIAEQYDVIFIDPLDRFAGVSDLNTARDWRKIYSNLMNIKCAKVIIDHLRKPSKDDDSELIHRVVGSSSKTNLAETIVVLEKYSKNSAENYKKLSFKLRRAAEPLPLTLRRDINTFTYKVVESDDVVMKTVSVEEIKRIWIKNDLPEKMAYADITKIFSDKFGVTQERIAGVLKEGKIDNIFGKEDGRKGKWFIKDRNLF